MCGYLQKLLSKSNKDFLRSIPAAKPVNFAFFPMMRWHGITSNKGFLLHALPTARVAFGCPISFAMSP